MKFMKIWAMIPEPLYIALHENLFRSHDTDAIVAKLLADYLVKEHSYTLEALQMEDY